MKTYIVRYINQSNDIQSAEVLAEDQEEACLLVVLDHWLECLKIVEVTEA